MDTKTKDKPAFQRGHKRSPSDVAFKELTRRDATAALSKDLGKLLQTAPGDNRTNIQKEFDAFEKLFSRFLQATESVEWDKIKLLEENTVKPYNQLPCSELGDVKGMLDKLVVLKLNGGLGTSMGCKGPKSVISVRNELTFLDLTVQQIENLNKQYGCNVPLVLMNSFNTDEDTAKVLRKYAQVNVTIKTFNQSMYPRLNRESLLPIATTMGTPQMECWYPPGHGDVYESFMNSGLLLEYIAQGKEYVFISNIDNLGATVDLSMDGTNYMRTSPTLVSVDRSMYIQPPYTENMHYIHHNSPNGSYWHYPQRTNPPYHDGWSNYACPPYNYQHPCSDYVEYHPRTRQQNVYDSPSMERYNNHIYDCSIPLQTHTVTSMQHPLVSSFVKTSHADQNLNNVNPQNLNFIKNEYSSELIKQKPGIPDIVESSPSESHAISWDRKTPPYHNNHVPLTGNDSLNYAMDYFRNLDSDDRNHSPSSCSLLENLPSPVHDPLLFIDAQRFTSSPVLQPVDAFNEPYMQPNHSTQDNEVTQMIKISAPTRKPTDTLKIPERKSEEFATSDETISSSTSGDDDKELVINDTESSCSGGNSVFSTQPPPPSVTEPIKKDNDTSNNSYTVSQSHKPYQLSSFFCDIIDPSSSRTVESCDESFKTRVNESNSSEQTSLAKSHLPQQKYSTKSLTNEDKCTSSADSTAIITLKHTASQQPQTINLPSICSFSINGSCKPDEREQSGGFNSAPGHLKYQKCTNGGSASEVKRMRPKSNVKRAPNTALPQSAVQVMNDWYMANISNPYPTAEQISSMSESGSVSVHQVRSWFSNKRNRSNNTRSKNQKRKFEERLTNLCEELLNPEKKINVDSQFVVGELVGLLSKVQNRNSQRE